MVHSIPIEILAMFTELKLRTHYIPCYNGANAVDFQLSSQLGYDIAKHGPERSYRIISEDKGYNPLVSYWSDRNLDISRFSIKHTNPHQHEKKDSPEQKEPARPEQTKPVSVPNPVPLQPQPAPQALKHVGPKPPAHVNNAQEYIRKRLLKDGFTKQQAHVAACVIRSKRNYSENNRLWHLQTELCRKFGNNTGMKLYNIACLYANTK